MDLIASSKYERYVLPPSLTLMKSDALPIIDGRATNDLGGGFVGDLSKLGRESVTLSSKDYDD